MPRVERRTIELPAARRPPRARLDPSAAGRRQGHPPAPAGPPPADAGLEAGVPNVTLTAPLAGFPFALVVPEPAPQPDVTLELRTGAGAGPALRLRLAGKGFRRTAKLARAVLESEAGGYLVVQGQLGPDGALVGAGLSVKQHGVHPPPPRPPAAAPALAPAAPGASAEAAVGTSVASPDRPPEPPAVAGVCGVGAGA